MIGELNIMDNQLRKLQLLQLEILKDVDQICNSNNLKYYLVGGTLLGAVRHKGFIPWDDDVDIAMYRQDYTELQNIIEKNYKEKYFIQNSYSDQKYSRFLPKIRLNGTLQVEKGIDGIDSHQGVYIDVFPLDYVSKKSGLALNIRGWIIRILYAYKTMRINTNKDMIKWKRIIKILFRWITYLIPDKLANRLFDFVCTMEKHRDCQYTTSFLSGYGWKRQMFQNNVYGEGTKLEFEGYSFNAPLQYEKILESLYKKYWELPPEEKRYVGHQLIKIDFGKYDQMLNSKLIESKIN